MDWRWRPQINWTEPKEERDLKWLISHQLLQLEQYLKQFGYAASLMATAEPLLEQAAAKVHESDDLDCQGHEIMQKMVGWMEIAGRDGVMTVYHFGMTLDALRTGAGRAPSLRGVIDSGRLKLAWKRFRDSFPFFEHHRHAVSHLADDVRTPEKFQALHPDSGLVIVGGVGHQSYTISYRDRHMCLDFTKATVGELDAIMTEVWEVFRPVSVRQ